MTQEVGGSAQPARTHRPNGTSRQAADCQAAMSKLLPTAANTTPNHTTRPHTTPPTVKQLQRALPVAAF